ncbi:hypothetical protein AAHA92_15152 [Salvia divinorum]|uniref:Uncharacterized protein n=1 Tax=Salvia divinorum TaxID=28513 RepID=A0ABD1HDU4_SALDI
MASGGGIGELLRRRVAEGSGELQATQSEGDLPVREGERDPDVSCFNPSAQEPYHEPQGFQGLRSVALRLCFGLSNIFFTRFDALREALL